MDALKFLKLDYKLTRPYLKSFLIFIALSFVFAFGMSSIFFPFGYLCFGATILINAPFNSEIGSTGFYEIVPGKSKTKVLGRFLYLLSFLLIITIIGAIISVIGLLSGKSITTLDLFVLLLTLSFTIILLSIQYTLNYKFGRYKSQFINSVVKLIPAILIFGGASLLGEFVNDTETSYVNILSFIENNLLLIILITILLTILCFIICLSISTKIYNEKDI